MQSRERVQPERVEPVPDELESAQAKLVYIYLEVADGATVDELSRALTMKKIDVLSVLNSLIADGFVEKTDAAYVVGS
ncbi:MarR family transcriptional regulator [Natrarchaeobius oligotrophus]|uniref:MarR family transcriptional regulator n=1 Tax=Natrarchaeobius chitinivorans TaxID=1679083 RepID=A0A3N6MUW1_NATCH|nr:MarR family transcriptional regulator [Natrarchaeobius chitinivorans]RQG98656.1 MarR family transcriptional regulator [Natrarchaeobius chitinivorans]